MRRWDSWAPSWDDGCPGLGVSRRSTRSRRAPGDERHAAARRRARIAVCGRSYKTFVNSKESPLHDSHQAPAFRACKWRRCVDVLAAALYLDSGPNRRQADGTDCFMRRSSQARTAKRNHHCCRVDCGRTVPPVGCRASRRPATWHERGWSNGTGSEFSLLPRGSYVETD